MVVTKYRNFDLLIARSGDRYRAFVVDAPGGEASTIFQFPFSADEALRLEALTGVHRGPSRAGQEKAEIDLTILGRTLFETVFCDKMQSVLADSLSYVLQNQMGLRLRLRFEEDAADLACLPWEILYDPTQGHFVGLAEQSPILRYLSLPRSRSALMVEPPLQVLAVLSSPKDLPLLDMDREWQAIQDTLAGLVAGGKFLLERLEPSCLATLQERLLGEPVHILHFVGHGAFDGAIGSLALEDARGYAQLLQGEQLAAVLRNHPSLRLVYLNACEGALASGQSVFTGVAQSLVSGGVPAAVAMQAEISDRGAIDLARTFYSALASGRPVDAALTQARVALNAAGSPEWASPVLFSRSSDNHLFDIREMLPTPDCPYPGMTPFTEQQKDLFFGRKQEIDDAVARLRKHPFLVVVGSSGSGKSSLIHAGILPALRRSRAFEPGEWTVKTMRPGEYPSTSLAAELERSPEMLSSVSFSDRTLLVIDQFEEVFTSAKHGEARGSLEALQSLIGRPNLYILLAVRADFYVDLMNLDPSLWQSIKTNRLELAPLNDDELWTAIVEPAARVGVTVDDALAVQLIADAAGQRGERGVLPLMQETLVLLWGQVHRRQLGLAAYREIAKEGRSGLQVAIDRHANTVFYDLDEVGQPIARRIFLRLIQFGEGRPDTRRQQTVQELRTSGDDPHLFEKTLDSLTEQRLLTTSGQEGDPSRRIDIAHEALIVGWSLLHEWLSERRTAERVRRRLDEKAKEWIRLEKSGGLLDAYEVQEAENWLAGTYSVELGISQDLLDLLDASRDALAEAEAEKARAERNRQRSWLLAGGLALAILGVAVIGWFWWQAETSKNEAVIARKQMNADMIAATGLTMIDESPQRALLLGVQAIRSGASETSSAISSLIQMVQKAADVPTVLEGSSGSEYWSFFQFSNDGRWLAQASTYNPEGWLWELRDGKPVPVTLSGLDRVTIFSISPDSRYLAAATGDGEVKLWPLDDASAEPTIMHSSGWVYNLGFSPDSSLLVAVLDDEAALGRETRVEIKNVLDPDEDPTVLAYDPVYIAQALTFSPDGKWMAIGSIFGNTWVWNLTTASYDAFTLPHSAGDVAFSPDSSRLATGDSDGIIRIWDLGAPETPSLALVGHTGEVNTLSFSPDGRWLASGSEDQLAMLWDLTVQSPEPIVLLGHQDEVFSVAFSPDGHWLATGGDEDGTVQLWDVNDPELPFGVLKGHEWGINALAFSPDGNWLASSSAAGTVRLWAVGQETLIEAACRSAGRNFGLLEWRRYFGELPYGATCPEFPIHPTIAKEIDDLIESRNFIPALQLYQDALTLSPEMKSSLTDQAIRIAILAFRRDDSAIANALIQDANLSGYPAIGRLIDGLVEAQLLAPALQLYRDALSIAPELKSSLTDQAIGIISLEFTQGDFAEAIALMEEASLHDLSLRFDVLMQYVRNSIEDKDDEAVLEQLQIILDLVDSDSIDDASVWNSLCWYGSLYGFAAKVVDEACEWAVEFAAEDRIVSYRDSRGLARAISGDIEGALQDFKFYVDEKDKTAETEHMIAMRREWIERLEAGEDPAGIFAPEILETLRYE